MYSYTPKGVCSRNITFDIKDNKVTNLSFVGGCNGNLQGLSKLAEGMDIDDVINRLGDIHCGSKQSSCPAELAKALNEYKEQQ